MVREGREGTIILEDDGLCECAGAELTSSVAGDAPPALLGGVRADLRVRLARDLGPRRRRRLLGWGVRTSPGSGAGEESVVRLKWEGGGWSAGPRAS